MATSRMPPTTQKARPPPRLVSVVLSLIVFSVPPNRMLKKSASGVLASLRSSTYRSVRLASSLAAVLLDGLFEHPVRHSHVAATSDPWYLDRAIIVFPQPAKGAARVHSTARVERAHSDRARSGSKGSAWVSFHPFHRGSSASTEGLAP